MKRTVKNRKQRFSNQQPSSIKMVVKIVLVALGCLVWGWSFLWVTAALYLVYPLIRAILSLIVGFGAVVAILYFLFSFL